MQACALQAINLPQGMDVGSGVYPATLPDPYVTIQLHNQNFQCTSDVTSNDANPVFDFCCIVSCEVEPCNLEFDIYDQDTSWWDTDDYIGTVMIANMSDASAGQFDLPIVDPDTPGDRGERAPVPFTDPPLRHSF